MLYQPRPADTVKHTAQGVANRDIKLENILLDESEPRPLIKICDFGYSKVGSSQDQRLARLCISTMLSSPRLKHANLQHAVLSLLTLVVWA